MEQDIQTPTTPPDEITLKEIILKVKEWWKFLLRNSLLIFVFAALSSAIGLAFAWTRDVEYTGELTFVLEESKSSSLGSYAGIASQFGLDLGGGGNMGLFSGDNLLQFLRSRLMIEQTLLSSVSIDNKETTLAEIYADIIELNKGNKVKKISFPAGSSRGELSRQQDSVLNFLCQNILLKNLVISKPDKKLGLISLKCTSGNEFFSKVFIEHLIANVTTFYVRTKTKRSQDNVDKLQQKTDSIEKLLNQKTYSAAASQDLNQNPARRIATVGTELVTRDKNVLLTMYGEVIKNLELSKMSLAQETPIIQIVDTPIYPLKKERFGKLKGILMGGFLGGFLIVIFMIIRRLYKSIMA